MKSRHLGTKLKRMMVTLLTAALLLSDNTILYAAEAGTAQTAIVSELEQDVLDENADSVSAGDAEVGEDTAIGKEERPINNKGDIPDTEDDLGTLEEFDGTVSGGDAVTPGRLPEQFYEEEKPETYGTLVSYDRYSRTYHVDGNQYVTVVGNDGATFIDDDGYLQPVDNTLEKETTAVFSMFGDEQETGYVNRANDYMVFLPENLDRETGKGITIASGDALITLYPAEGSFINGLAKDNAIRYSDVFPGVDYQYTVLGNSVKEDIILLEQGERNSFSYFIDTCDLAGEIKNNTLYLYESGTDPEMDAVFVLEAPEMVDSADEISFGVRLSMQDQDGMLLVTVTADEGWLSAPERVYPVRIDPTAIQVTGSAIRMACAEEGSPNTVIGDNQYPYVGYDDGVTSGNYAGFGSRHLNCRTYFAIDYDFGSLLSEAEIVVAAFQVTQKTRWSKGMSEFGLYGVEEAWEVNGLNWNNQLSYSHYFLDAQNASATRGEALSFDVTEEVSAWINGTAQNHGFVMKAQVEAPNREQAAAGVKMQCEVLYNNASAKYAPKLILSWTGELADLDSLSLDDTTIDIYPVVERRGDKSTNTLGIVAHGQAGAGSTVHYQLVNGSTGEVEAQTSLVYPDSGLYAGAFPTAVAYNRRLSNWQSEVFANLTPGQVYYITAYAEGLLTDPLLPGAEGLMGVGATVTSDTFLIYEEGAFDLIPRIALHYGVDVNTIMADMQMQDALTVEGNRLFIRNPQNTAPYVAGELSDYWKAVLDGLLLGRAENCEFGFEPVNLNTGNFYMEQTDAEIPDIGGSFAFTRQYNSKGAGYAGSLGYGWSTPFDERLGELSDGMILWLSGTGSIVAFNKTAGGYAAPAGYDYVLEEEGDGFVLTDLGSLEKHMFNAYGMLTGMEDIYGNRTTLSYDMDYRLCAITSPSGKNYIVTLDEKNRIAQIGLPGGNHIGYTYDGAGNLVTVTDAAGDQRTYTYDAKHRMTAWQDENGNCVVANVYDGEGRVTEQTDAEGGKITLSYGGGSTTAVDANGNTTVYNYDGQYRTTGITYADGTTESRTYNAEGYLSSVTDRQGVKTAYTYDGNGNLRTQTRQDGAVRSYAYTEAGQIASVTEYDGGVTIYTYDEKHRLASVTDAEGGVTRYGYDGENRLVSETDARGAVTSYTYEGACIVGMTDAEGGIWSFGYDAMNRLIRTTNPLGAVTTKTYNAKGWCVAETDAAGNSTTYTFDPAGAVTAITDREGQKSVFTYDKMNRMLLGKDPLGNTLAYTYDASGNRLTETDAEGNVTSYTYDAMNRRKEVTDPEGGVTAYTYDHADRVESVTDRLGHTRLLSYDAVTGSLLTETDERGNVTSYETDLCGRTTKVTYADGSMVSYAYDRLGRLTEVTNQLGTITRLSYDANGNVVRLWDDESRVYTYVYDRLDRLVKSTDSMGGTVLYTYDALGSLLSVTDELGNTTDYGYDALGRLVSVTDALGGNSAYTYDREDRVLSVVTPEGRKTAYTYDAIGQMTEAQDASGNSITYTYDKISRIIGMADATGSLLTYTYDKNSNLIKAADALGNAHTYQVDAEGSLLADTYPDGEKDSYTYLATGEVATYTDRYGIKTTLTYDAMGRVAEASDTAGNRMTYEYDAAGNLVKQTDVLGRSAVYEYDTFGRVVSVTDVDGAVTLYAYDVLDRLVSVTDPAGSVTAYTYDAAGNLTGQTLPGEAVYAYAYDALNRLAQKIDPEGAATTFAYDGDGNLTVLTDGNGVQTAYSYDALSRLVAYTDGNGGQTQYTYDGRNNLTAITTPEGITERYGYDAVGNILTVTNGMGETWQYEYDALYRIVKQTSPLGAQESYAYDRHDVVTGVTDALGSTTDYEVNANGQVVRKTLPGGGIYSYSYDAVHRLTGITTPLGYETTFTYNAGDDVIKQEDNLSRTTLYSYDVLHNLLSVTDPEGGVTSYSYDVRSNRTAMTNVLGNTFVYAYDRTDRMVTVTDPEQKAASVVYDMVGNIESITTPGERTTRYGYDNNYNRNSVTDPMGYTYSYTYDKDDRLTGMADPLGQTVIYAYDKANRLVSYTDKRGLTESYTYDAHGNVLSRTDASGLTTTYVYDLMDRLTSVTDAMGSTAFYTYDVMGNLIAVTDYLGRGTQYTYDVMGNLTGVTDVQGRTEEMAYDMAGRLTSYTSNSGNTITYDYDKLDSLVEKAYTDAQGEENGAPAAYAYDVLGERAAMYDSTGDTEYTYDSLGRITSVTTYRAPGEGEGSFSHEKAQGDTVAYTYDGADNLAAITYPDGTRVSYEYDLNDNLIKVTDREGLVTSYVYDAINRITEIHRPNGISTYNTYNEADQITELVNSCDDCGWVVSRYVYTYDERGFITGEKAVESLAGYAWDGRLEKHDKNSAFAYRTVETDRTFVYDDAGKLLSVTETEAGCGTCVYTYEYDLMGNRTAAIKTNTAGTVVENRKYVYNESNQLAEAVLCDGKTTRKVQYTYDADGNLTGEYSPTDRSLTTYTYTVENRLEAVYTGTAYSQTLQMAAAYDGDGNRVYQMNYNPDKDEDFSDYYCTYNSCDYKGTGIRLRAEGEVSSAERELLSLITASGAITDSSYELIEYINDVNREYAEVLVEQNINGTLDTAYVYGAAIGAGSDRLSLDHFDSTGYYLYDPRGSVTGITNEEGQIYQSYRYSVFGEITFGASQYENEYTYNGESYNPNIKSQYLRARYYCVVTADFLTEDSYLGNIAEPLTLNRYNYCVGNPLNYVDPSGNIPFFDGIKDIIDGILDAISGFFSNDKPEAKTVVGIPIPPTPTPAPTEVPGGGQTWNGVSPSPEGYLNQQVENAEQNRNTEECTNLTIQDAIDVLDEYLKGNVSEEYAQKYVNYLAEEENELIELVPTIYHQRNYQRYDEWIKGWSRYYNIKRSANIDPNVIKAMMYKESKMGYDPSTSPNANISRDVMQAIDIRNSNIFEYIKIDLNNVRVAISTDKDENGNYVKYGTIMDMGYSETSLDMMKINEEYAIINRLLNTSIDGSGQGYDGNFESNQIYFYQYKESTPFLSIAMGIDKLRREMEKTDDLYTAIYNYNTRGPEYPTDVLKIVNHDYVDLEREIK
ncbi:MAG: DNRLRE domain-containing protein [Lachnospiraceae bacterium]|nr:DNRLRE domain-containing protein [Lachnospiraceae bacterium]